MSRVTEIKGSEFDERALKAQGLVMVDFSATWCGPCKRMLPELEAAAEQLGDAVTVLKVDVDEASDIAGRYGVQGIPNLTFFRDGKVVDVSVGLMPRAAILARAQHNLDLAPAASRQG